MAQPRHGDGKFWSSLGYIVRPYLKSYIHTYVHSYNPMYRRKGPSKAERHIHNRGYQQTSSWAPSSCQHNTQHIEESLMYALRHHSAS